MKQQDFESIYNKLWLQLEEAVENKTTSAIDNFPLGYRRICHHLAIAKHRRYSAYLIERLNHLVLQSHHLLYKHNPKFSHQLLKFLIRGFPQALITWPRHLRCRQFDSSDAIICALWPATVSNGR